MGERIYLVMKLLTELEFVTSDGAEIYTGPVAGLRGFIPVYRTLEEAEEASENGRFAIMTMAVE